MTTNMYGASAIHKLRRPVFGLFEPPSPQVDFCRQLHDPPFDLHRFFMTSPPSKFQKIFAIFFGNFLREKLFFYIFVRAKNQALFWCNRIYDLRRFDIKPPSPLVDEHRYFGNPPSPLSVYVAYGRHLIWTLDLT